MVLIFVSCPWIRVVHGSDGPAGRVGAGRGGSRFGRILPGRASTSGFQFFFKINKFTYLYDIIFGS